jgi:hypothetical protein
MRRWYYTRDNRQRLGPVTPEQLRQLALSGAILPEHSVMPESGGKWVLASKVKGLFPEVPSLHESQVGAAVEQAGEKEVLDVLPAGLPPQPNDDVPDVIPIPDEDVLDVILVGTPLRRGHSPARSASARRRAFRRAPSASGNRVQYFAAPRLDLSRLGDHLLDWLEREDFTVQTLPTEDGGILVQIEKRGSWRNVVGMSTALNIVLDLEGEELRVEIGAGKWVDKAVVGAIGMFVLWPLAVTAAIGAWDQSKMPERVFGYVSDYVHRRRGPAAVTDQPPARPQAPPPSADAISQLKELAALRDQGVLTEEEFQAQTARLLQ